MKEELEISAALLDAMAQMEDANHNALPYTARDPQPVNGRTVSLNILMWFYLEKTVKNLNLDGHISLLAGLIIDKSL